jgi:putative iron-only hydrogenase system regulator
MDNRLSVLSIIVEDRTSAAKINDYLHEWGEYIVGRMGLPYRERELSVICVVMDAPGDVTSALSGKLGMLPGVQVKTVTSKAALPPRKAEQ